MMLITNEIKILQLQFFKYKSGHNSSCKQPRHTTSVAPPGSATGTCVTGNYREFQGKFREFRGKIQGKVQGISGKLSGNFREKYREFQGIPGKSTGNFRELQGIP